MLKRNVYATLLGSILIAAACTFKGRAGATTFGNSFELEVEAGGIKAPATPENPPAGTCVKFTFFDGSGNALGSAEGTVGGEPVPAPDGTEEVGVSPCDPDDPDPKKKAKRIGGARQRVVAGQLREFGFRLMPFDYEDGHARQVDYVVTANNLDEAESLSAEFVKDLFAEPCEAQITPGSAADIQFLADGRVRFSMFSVGMPDSLAFDWNGTPLFTLADASVIAMNGWYVTTVHVPASMVDSSMTGASNNATYSLVVDGRDYGTSLQLTVTP
jgi:hypothetical protein